MGLLGKIWVKLGLDNSELDKGFKDSEKSASGFQNSLKKIGGMMAAAFSVTAVINFAKASVKAYNESALAAAKLESVLRSTGGAAGLTSGQMQTYAKELQSITMFEDDATINAMALMATFKSVKGDIFKQAIASAQDLSTVLGTDLNGAVLQLGKALESPEIGMTMLRRSGISFTTEQIEGVKKLVAEGKKYEAQLIILKEVQSQFGGAAKAAGETAAGSWVKAKNAFGDLMETIGSGTEKTKGFANSLKVWFEQLNKVVTSDSLSFWQKLTAVLGGNVNAFRKANEEFAKNTEYQKQLEANADAVVSSVKSVADAEHMLASMDKKNQTELSKLIAEKLNGYIKAAAATQLQTDLEREAAAESAKAKAAEEAAAKAEQMGIDGTIKRYQYLISEIEKKILATNVNDQTTLQTLNNEKAGLENLIKPWSMTTAEAKTYRAELEAIEKMRSENAYFPLTVPKGRASVDKKGAELVAPSDEQVFTDFYAWQLDQGEEAIKRLEGQKDQMVAIAEEMNRAITYAISDGLQTLVEQLVTTGQVDMGSVVSALLSPFGDMLIRLGEMAIMTGTGIAAIEESFETMNPYVALAAGAAMIALGSLIKSGVASIGKTGSSSAGSATSFSGGNSFSGNNAMSLSGTPIKVEITGKLAGQDIVLAGDNYKKNRLR